MFRPARQHHHGRGRTQCLRPGRAVAAGTSRSAPRKAKHFGTWGLVLLDGSGTLWESNMISSSHRRDSLCLGQNWTQGNTCGVGQEAPDARQSLRSNLQRILASLWAVVHQHSCPPPTKRHSLTPEYSMKRLSADGSFKRRGHSERCCA